jgi:hypothetical protein
MDERTLFWLTQLLRERVRERFYGELTLTFQDGRVVLVRTTQTHKPPA